MLTPEERELVEPLLLSVVAVAAFPRQSLVSFMDIRLSSRLGEGSPAVLVEQALRISQDDGYRESPPALVRLLNGLLPGREEILAIADRLKVAPPAATDPFDAVVLYSNLVFLERGPTRQALKSFLKELRPAKRVVVVNGEESPGKSYTTAFVEHVLSDQPGAAHCPVVVRDNQGAAVGPLELARDMVTSISGVGTGAPPENTNQERWISELVDWVLSSANLSDYSWWFVLDGFNANELRPDTQQFIVTLATRLGGGVQRDRHRLILLDFDRTVLAVPPGSVSDQTTSPVSHGSVKSAVELILAEMPPDLDRDEVAADILRDLSDPITDLRELGIRLGAIVETAGATA